VLDTARLEAGKLKLVSGYVPVATLISNVVGGARRTTETLNIELDTRVEPGVPPVFVDAARMQQALLGLVLHLAHTGAPGSPIALRASRAKGPPGPGAQVRIFVDAPGMDAPSDPSLLFEAFRFSRRESGMHAGGLGLGLSLARALVEAQGGAIWFEAPSTVCVALPREGH
jgi:signal transduction histidine kinase